MRCGPGSRKRAFEIVGELLAVRRPGGGHAHALRERDEVEVGAAEVEHAQRLRARRLAPRRGSARG